MSGVNSGMNGAGLSASARNVLVVDDEPRVLAAIEDELAGDYRVFAESSPRFAIKRLAQEKDISVIISDQRMSEMSGYEFFARAQQISGATRILITGYTDIDAMISAVNEGHIFGYISKPWNRDHLRLLVMQASEHFSLLRELNEEKTLLHKLMDNIPDAIFFKDRKHRFLRINRAAAAELGVAHPGEALGKAVGSFVSPELARKMEEEEKTIFAGGAATADRIVRLERDAGKVSWLSVTRAPIPDEKRQISGIVGIHRDITERMLAEEALRESEERFRDIAEVASDWIWETDEEHCFKLIAGESTKPTGYDRQDILGKTRWELSGVDLAQDEHWRLHKADLDARRTFRDFRYSMVDKSGGPLHVSISGKPVHDASGNFRGYRGTATNVTPIIEALRRAEAAEVLLRDAVESISEGFVIFDRDDRLVMCNDAYRRLYESRPHLVQPGIRFEEVVRETMRDGLLADAIGHEEEWLEERLRQHRNPEGAIEQRLAGGRTILITERRMRTGGIAGLRIDITPLKQAEAALRASEDQLRSIAENLPGAIFRCVLRPDGTIAYEYVSDGTRKIYGIEPRAIVSGELSLADLVHPDDRAAVAEGIKRSAAELAPYEIEYRIETPKAGTRWLRSAARPVRRKDGSVVWDGVALDITELKKLEADRDYLAYYDQLTGLPNRALLVDRLGQALERALRFEALAVVVAIELITLKDIRDSSGFRAGDAAIREIARRLQDAAAGGDTVARIGDGEFLLVLSEIGKDGEVTAPLREIRRLCEEPLLLDGKEYPLKIAMGVSAGPEDGDEAEILIRNAATALNRGKATPGQTVQFYSAHMTQHAVHRLSIEAELRRALEKEELLLHYQPVVAARTLEIVGSEALIRWRHPERGLIPPGEFIPVAEETGLIAPLGEFALRSACAQTREWHKSGLKDITISVNLSGWQLLQEKLGDRLLAIVRESGLSPNCLKLELTESTILHNAEAAAQIMGQLAAEGVRFSVDDFGIEHSALSHLSRLPIETLKIDYSFVSKMTNDSAHAALVQAIISMTHAMGKQAVAEGVETLIQLTYLQAYQCDAIQGFLFSRPVPPELFLPLLERRVIEPVEVS